GRLRRPQPQQPRELDEGGVDRGVAEEPAGPGAGHDRAAARLHGGRDQGFDRLSADLAASRQAADRRRTRSGTMNGLRCEELNTDARRRRATKETSTQSSLRLHGGHREEAKNEAPCSLRPLRGLCEPSANSVLRSYSSRGRATSEQ